MGDYYSHRNVDIVKENHADRRKNPRKKTIDI